jgi:hypothetical protein
MPNLEGPGAYPPETIKWLGRAHALIAAQGDINDVIEIKRQTGRAVQHTDDDGDRVYRKVAAREIAILVYRALATAELHAPASVQGAFIPAGNAFDAVTAISKILEGAKSDVLIVDPYMDEKTLIDFAPLASEGVTIRLLADENSRKPTLHPAVERWKTQYGPRRPISAKLAASHTLHDRLIMVDGSQVWILTQSLKDFAARSPASIVRADDDAAALKVTAYQSIWDAATSIG